MLDVLADTKEEQQTGAHEAPDAFQRLSGIAILGSQPQTKMLAPFSDSRWLVYACSPDNTPFGLGRDHCCPLPRVDQFFEIHVPVEHPTRPFGYLKYVADLGVPVWMRDERAMPSFPTARRYPEAEMKARFGPFTFTSTIAFMLAKAIVDIEAMVREGRMRAESPPMIGLYGILQMGKDEYAKQRQGTQNLMWAATQAGIKVLVHPESRLLEPPPEDF